MDGGSVSEMIDVCFYQIVDLDLLNNNDTFVYMEGNIAPTTGYAIYAGGVMGCIILITYMDQMSSQGRNLFNISQAILVHVFQFRFLDISINFRYEVSSHPVTICFCNPGPELMCTTVVANVIVYPGQTFNISAV